MAYQSMETPEDLRSRSRSRRIASMKLTDDDLLVEILSRLPVKSLLRFACVSSSWYNIINSPDNFYRRNKLPPRMYGFIYFSSCPRIPSAERNYAFCAVPPNLNTSDVFIEDASTRLLLPFLPPHDDLSVQDCCNGLVLCECRGPTSPLERTSFVCNPATKTWDRIPRGRNQDLCFIKALAFDPQVSPHYKIVTITLITDGAHIRTEMEILSSETGEWVVYKDCKGDGFLYFSAVQDNFGDVHAFFKGNIHVPDRDELTVMAADIERRIYREMKLPNTTEGDVLKVHLAVVAGRLRCAQQTYNHRIVVLDLEDYDGGEWSLRYRVNLLDVNLVKWPEVRKLVVDPFSTTDMWDLFSGTMYIEAQHPDLDVIFLTIENKLICYHLSSDHIVDVITLRGYSESFYFTYLPCYTSYLKTK